MHSVVENAIALHHHGLDALTLTQPDYACHAERTQFCAYLSAVLFHISNNAYAIDTASSSAQRGTL